MADVDQSVSAIDQKNSENNDDSTSDENQSDWVGFLKSIVTNFLFISVFIIIGSNFIFFTYYDSLDMIFPVSRKVYFPGSKQSGGGKKQQRGGGTSYTCPKSGTKTFKMSSQDVLKSLGYDGTISGWPYTMYSNQDEWFSWAGFKNWFAVTEGESFMIYRKFMHILFKGGDNNLFQKVPQPLLYILANIIFSLCFFVGFMGFITTIFKSFTCVSHAWAYSLIGLLLVYTSIMCFANGFLQHLSFLWNMLVVPLIIDHNVVRQICSCNMWWLSLLFGAMAVGSGIQYLDNITWMVMMIVWIILAIKQIFF